MIQIYSSGDSILFYVISFLCHHPDILVDNLTIKYSKDVRREAEVLWVRLTRVLENGLLCENIISGQMLSFQHGFSKWKY